ncbi:cell division protein ZapA [Luteibaculum oceani]|uniref:Cell division protein ZapA n=1 Tax=Luteibaculum oceani TaxID=1294296 RepID=A0A5C6V1Q0_9FLAO|nr:cell division protein ZapA [Luteibaculum oceani]TXC76915.1 cell division protein ZapA [Luteibaculum oceani]
MSDLSIKITVGGRVYPLTVSVEEEEFIRKAADLIEDHVKKFQENYAVKDKQDLLAMTALQIATQNLLLSDKKEVDAAKNELEQIEAKLDFYLENTSI